MLLRLSALCMLLSACLPQLPEPTTQERQVSYQQSERAVTMLPGVQRVAITATAAVVSVDANADVATVISDVARVTGLPKSAIVVRTAPVTVALLQMGPWTLATASRWPLVGTAVAILALFAGATGYLAWRMRPRSQR